MPCWTVNTVSVEFSAKYVEILMAAIESLGMQGYYNAEEKIVVVEDKIVIELEDKTAQVMNNNFDLLNKLKRAYSRTAIETVAKKRRWALQQTGKNKMVMRRY